MQQFYFDRAVWVFGTTLEADLEKAGEKGKNAKQIEAAKMRMLQRWLGSDVVGFAQAPAGPTRTS